MNASPSRLLSTSAIIAASLFVSLLFPALSPATETEGLALLGFGLNWTNIGAEDESGTASPDAVYVDDSGIGGTLSAGYGFGPALAFRVEASATAHDTSEPDGQFYFPNIRAAMPYIFPDMETGRPHVLCGPRGVGGQL